MKRLEEALHINLVKYLRMQYPHVRFRSGLEGFHLSTVQARLNKRIQWGPGAPDIMIYHTSKDGKHCGLFLELKTKTPYKKSGELLKSQHLATQDGWHVYLQKHGWLGGFGWSFEMCKEMIDNYLKR